MRAGSRTRGISQLRETNHRLRTLHFCSHAVFKMDLTGNNYLYLNLIPLDFPFSLGTTSTHRCQGR